MDQELRNELCHYFTDCHRFHLTADELLITCGSQEAMDLVARALVKPRDAVMLERPTYSTAIDIFRRQGATIVPVEIHPYGYDMEQVEKLMQTYKPRLFYLNPTFQSPTGYIVPAEQRKRLVELAERYQCLLLEDDPYRDIYFGEEPPRPLFAYDTAGWVIYLRSFSKYIALGIAIVACRPSIMNYLIKAKLLSDSGTPVQLDNSVAKRASAREKMTANLALFFCYIEGYFETLTAVDGLTHFYPILSKHFRSLAQ